MQSIQSPAGQANRNPVVPCAESPTQMTDAEREQAIAELSTSMESAWGRWERFELMSDYNLARTLMQRRDDLVKGRSAGKVFVMEVVRGLT